MPHDSTTGPRYSIISAVYGVAGYLPDFIASVEAQTHPLDDVEVIMVDDGSTDGSLALLQDWQRRRPELVTVLRKPNGGQASARNVGIEAARGQWLTFPDPDDTLAPDYLAQVHALLAAHPAAELVATDRVLVDEATGRQTPHPLARQFAGPDRLRDLAAEPEYFHGSAPAAFLRADVLRRTGLRFDERIRPNFEDGHLCASYLLAVERPLVGFAGSARYYYRKRADQSSTLNTSKLQPGRYTDVLRYGYLDVLHRATRRYGRVPHWLQNFLLYELSWYFRDEEAASGLPTALHGAVADEFNELLPRIAGQLEPEVVAAFALAPFPPLWRDILRHGYRAEPWHAPGAVRDRLDERQRAQRVTYRFTHALPAERFVVDGMAVRPYHAKVRAPRYFERVLVQERLVWLPAGAVRLELDGAGVPVTAVPAASPAPARRPRPGGPRSWLRRLGRAGYLALLRLLAASPPVRRRYAGAWVLMDRIEDADDSAEHLFRYLVRERPGVNAWFVIGAGTPAERRLRGDGLPRVVAHGTLSWTLLMLHCAQLISSHADRPITHPRALARFGPPRWRFVFLQHGVIKDDLSGWLNPKNADIFVVSTPGELHSIVDDGTAYTYTTRETQLTGLPRFDLLRAAGEAVPPADRDLILVAPTWRSWLAARPDPARLRWHSDPAAFRDSGYARSWRAVLTDPALAELATAHGRRVALLMHPNLQHVVEALDLPPGVERLDFETGVRTAFARAAVLVTDYSSMAFNAAYLDRPVVYFQFDRELMFGGGHVGRGGYFDYHRDGFGPVAETAPQALAAIRTAVEAGPVARQPYAARIAEAFPVRDGRCCERVADAIEASVRPLTPRRAD